ncbi:MAG TPA: ATP synthase F1 subunit delta [Bryobacteraceae bacterium]|jgi:F-type H+-transporting ATPase subunit delta|nr:ATP synthase F1 subunit delta [Bryobacteraceae bacterium]
MLSAISTRYAKALVDVVTEPGSNINPQQAMEQLRQVAAMVSSSEDLRNALLSPAVSPGRKRAVMAKLTEPLNVHVKLRNFLYVVIDHRRVHEIPSMVEAFEVLLDEYLGFVRADVSSALPLNDSQKASLEAQLTRVAGKKAKPNFKTDPALVAGVVARVGSKVYDGSVRGQLERLRATLLS